MLQTLFIFPLPFWVVVGLLVGGGIYAWGRVQDGSGVPTLAVLVTVATWYVGDALYNDYAGYHVEVFEGVVLKNAWWQVACFLAVFLVATPSVHSWINGRDRRLSSGVVQMFHFGVGHPRFQHQLNLLFAGCVAIWFTLILVAAIRLGGELPYYFFPFLGHKAEPWVRSRFGSGFDAVYTAAFYFQQLVTAIFGVVAALSTNRRTRMLALTCCLFSWPYFIFDRTRNSLLVAVMPGILAWGLLRVRGGMLKKFVVLGLCFLLVNAWMGFIIANRSGNSITTALKEQGFSLTGSQKVHHEGLNMFEELCWMNAFIKQGSYQPNWGGRYFAEAVNAIPRTIWPGKPTVGIDYCVVRGGGGGEEAGQGGISTSFSTGLIGQGVANFDRVLGPAAAALLMSLWVAALARLDLRIHKFGHLPLYGTGLILTFNLGRDITLITLYPFVFGYLAIWLRERLGNNEPGQNPRPTNRRGMVSRPAGRRGDPALPVKAVAPRVTSPHVARRNHL